jgi:hypothetical protein
MLYKFKSKAAGDLIMLQANGERMLQIIGKEPGPKGIVLPEQMPAGHCRPLNQAIAARASRAAERPESAEAFAATDARTDDTPAADRHQPAPRAPHRSSTCSSAATRPTRSIVWGV